jgi:hypothetical protein
MFFSCSSHFYHFVTQCLWPFTHFTSVITQTHYPHLFPFTFPSLFFPLYQNRISYLFHITLITSFRGIPSASLRPPSHPVNAPHLYYATYYPVTTSSTQPQAQSSDLLQWMRNPYHMIAISHPILNILLSSLIQNLLPSFCSPFFLRLACQAFPTTLQLHFVFRPIFHEESWFESCWAFALQVTILRLWWLTTDTSHRTTIFPVTFHLLPFLVPNTNDSLNYGILVIPSPPITYFSSDFIEMFYLLVRLSIPIIISYLQSTSRFIRCT